MRGFILLAFLYKRDSCHAAKMGDRAQSICFKNLDHKYRYYGIDRILVLLGQMTSLWVISPPILRLLRPPGGPGF